MKSAAARSALPQIEAVRTVVTLQGTSPLVMCSWMTRGTRAGLPRDEQSELARFRMSDGSDAVPVGMLRAAVKTASRLLDTHDGALFLGTEDSLYAPLAFKKDELREFQVSTRGSKAAKSLVRVVYHGWSVELPVEYQEPIWSTGSVVTLLGVAGERVGIGQLRPEHTGTYGTFRVIV